MGIEFYFIVVVMLMMFAVFDLMVGVSNDAVNFLNSSIGSKAAPFNVIILVASLGILAGVTFSGGMMEVARKGIFHPQFFTMPDLLTIFLTVMLTDILLLDVFNSNGLPTSTTVSIVFELIGAAVAVSLIKIAGDAHGGKELWEYINTAKAMSIIFGILMSIIIAFIAGAVVQFLTRTVFTFDITRTLPRYGALFGGVAMAAITFFILIKGAKGATFMDEANVKWIQEHTLFLLGAIFIVSAGILQVLLSVFRINILKPIILVGTFALAMAFAANDLVNFIGVPLAGLSAFTTATASADPLTIPMAALSKSVKSNTLILLTAGFIMVLTLWLSKKARSVTETEISLGQQHEGTERFESIWLSRRIVNTVDILFGSAKMILPGFARRFIRQRISLRNSETVSDSEKPAFDLIRASVNLMVASAVVSFATSMKLPLSTTYVTFMVAMGTSFSDQAWGRESAVYRVTGVLTVVGGWFMTALIAFTVSFIFACIIHYGKVPGLIFIIGAAGFIIWKNHVRHREKESAKDEMKIFKLENVEDCGRSVSDTFGHLAYLLEDMRHSIEAVFEGLFEDDLVKLRHQRKKTKQYQLWTNIIISNIFEVLRKLQSEERNLSYNYYQIIRRLQKLSDGYRDTVIKATLHVGNRHKGLEAEQISELTRIKDHMLDIFQMLETDFRKKELTDYHLIKKRHEELKQMAGRFNENQIHRIRNDQSKTRLSILFYAVSGNCVTMARQNVKLVEIFNETFRFDDSLTKFYLKDDSD
ncbi:MAG: inorganic phosphate transporter [Desulfobacteraceae bacterium]